MTMVAYEGEERPELNLEEEESEETFGRIVAEPLEAGFGITIGNALRRTLLSALPGTAITVSLGGHSARGTADTAGEWSVELPTGAGG